MLNRTRRPLAFGHGGHANWKLLNSYDQNAQLGIQPFVDQGIPVFSVKLLLADTEQWPRPDDWHLQETDLTRSNVAILHQEAHRFSAFWDFIRLYANHSEFLEWNADLRPVMSRRRNVRQPSPSTWTFEKQKTLNARAKEERETDLKAISAGITAARTTSIQERFAQDRASRAPQGSSSSSSTSTGRIRGSVLDHVRAEILSMLGTAIAAEERYPRRANFRRGELAQARGSNASHGRPSIAGSVDGALSARIEGNLRGLLRHCPGPRGNWHGATFRPSSRSRHGDGWRVHGRRR